MKPRGGFPSRNRTLPIPLRRLAGLKLASEACEVRGPNRITVFLATRSIGRFGESIVPELDRGNLISPDKTNELESSPSQGHSDF